MVKVSQFSGDKQSERNFCNNFKSSNKPRREGDPDILVANSDLCKKILNWVPKITLLIKL